MKHQTALEFLWALMLVSCSVPTVTSTPQPIVVKGTPEPTAAPPTATRQPSLTPVLEPTATLLPPTPTLRSFLRPISAQPVALVGTPIVLPEEVISPENVGQLVEWARWGNGFVYDVQYSPKGDLIAVASSLGIYFYDIASGKEIELIETSYPIREIAFSPDGRLLATSGDENVVWNLEKDSIAYTAGRRATDLEFSSNGEWLVISEFQAVRLFRATDGTEVYSLSTGDILGGKVTFTLDGQSIISVTEFGTLRLWDVASEDLLKEVYISALSSDENGNAECITLGDIAVDGQTLAIGCNEFAKLMIIDLPSLQLIRLIDTADWVQSVALSSDGRRVATGDYSGNVQMWDVESGQLLVGFRGAGVPQVDFSPDGTALAVGHFYSDVSVRRINDGQVIKQFSDQTPNGNLAVSPDGSLAAIEAFRDVQLRRTSDGVVVRTLDWQPIRAMSKHLPIQLPAFSRLMRSGPNNVVTDVAFSSNGELVAAAYDAGDVRIWQANNGNLVTVLAAEDYPRKLVFSPDGRYLAVESYGAITIIDAKTWEPFKNLRDRLSSGGGSFAFSPDGMRLARKIGDDAIQIWDTTTWSEDRVMKIGKSSYEAQLAFLGDNTTLSVATANGLQFWDTTNSELVWENSDFADVANDIAISPDSSLLVTLGASGYLAGDSNYIWDLNSQRLITRFGTSNEHSGYYSAAFTPDGKLLVVTAEDGTVRLWGVKP